MTALKGVDGTPAVDASIMLWFECGHCNAPTKDKVPLKAAIKGKIPVTCGVCQKPNLIKNVSP